MKNYKLEAHAGEDFSDVAKKAKEIARQTLTVEFDFNGVVCLVNKNTNLDWLFRDYMNSWTMEWKTVGADCVEKYSPEVQSELDSRNKIKEEKQAEESAKYRAQEEKEISNFEEKVKGIELELSDIKSWNESREKNSDSYGSAALDYAEGWAKLMQIEIAKGKTVKECADYTQEGLGFLGITGFMYGCAVSILSQTWKHGEELRKWHNKEYGVGEDKEGVVNPAVLIIGG